MFGDYNIRIGDNLDYIAGVDKLPEKDIVDFQTNQYCDTFLDFLFSTNLCVLNGRQCKTNDFTSISSKGSAVVDYCLVPYENLNKYCNFEVIRSRDIVNRCINIDSLENHKILDHSILTWTLCLNTEIKSNQNGNGEPYFYKKYDCSSVPIDFMTGSDTLQRTDNLVHEMEAYQNQQHHLDLIYDRFCKGVKSQMDSQLNRRTIILNGNSNKKRRIQKPLWNEELSKLWNDLCITEKQWIKCKTNDRTSLKQIFVNRRKLFDRAVQRRKRTYWQDVQNDLLQSCKVDTNEFWKKLGGSESAWKEQNLYRRKLN